MDSVARAKEITEKILEMTKQLSFTGETDEAEKELAAYIELIEAREPLVKELLELNIDDKVRNSKEYQVVKQTLAEIAKLDKGQMDFVQEMHETIKDAIKLAKQGQRVNKGYQSGSSDDVASRFDIKQ